ncbi:MAG: 4Fe-4S dicluster domain-containing protein [Betaproteobacteria bacterium]|nr:MAG: 4Fe-4S dicluster domain-containing protein [Betaproteobacteria bacterium]
MPLDADALVQILELAAPLPMHTQLCQKELAAFGEGSAGDTLVACTQEQARFGEVAVETGKTQRLSFVNIREAAGWSAEARAATPKIAALLAAAALPEPEPVPRVTFQSEGRLLIVGPADAALRWAEGLKEQLDVTVLITGKAVGSELPAERGYPIYSGKLERLAGWLGAFEAAWSQENPIDLDVCTRCNACIKVCPEQAIDWSYQIDLDRCRDHRKCVVACGAIGAIDFDRSDLARSEAFDLVLDLGRDALFSMHQPPQGYWHPGADAAAQAAAVAEIAGAVGSFEKPKYFNYKASICAHSRSEQPGCNLCIEVCSTAAIRADGDYVFVEPHLCMGCGACATVCPSGAMTYAYPSVPDLGTQVRTLLATYRAAGGRDACLLFHDAAGRELILRLGRRGKGLPARVIPVELQHMVSAGIDVWLGALAYGASDIAVLATGAEAPQYADAIARQMGFCDAIAQALGYQGMHAHLLRAGDVAALEAAVWALRPALAVRAPATFHWTADKRATIALAVEHLLAHAPTPQSTIALAAGAPFGTIVVNRDTCTMCLACVGACPEGAILDHPQAERPELRFIETKCVQCGICAATCPEDAITLEPRLLLTAAAREPRLLNEAAIFNCIRCGKPLGTEKMVGNMLAKLAGHSMFAAPGALDRLKMCADCRVIDMMQSELPTGRGTATAKEP